jgi:hypothetical protein
MLCYPVAGLFGETSMPCFSSTLPSEEVVDKLSIRTVSSGCAEKTALDPGAVGVQGNGWRGDIGVGTRTRTYKGGERCSYILFLRSRSMVESRVSIGLRSLTLDDPQCKLGLQRDPCRPDTPCVKVKVGQPRCTTPHLSPSNALVTHAGHAELTVVQAVTAQAIPGH